MSLFKGLLGRREQPPSDPRQLLKTVREFIQAETLLASQHIVEIHPELLSDEADSLLAQLAGAQEDDQGRQLIKEHRTLLTRCREVGVETAFAEKMKQGLPSEPLQILLDTLPTEQQQALIEIMSSASSLNDLEQVLARNPVLQAALAQAGVIEPKEPKTRHRMASARAIGAPVPFPPEFRVEIDALRALSGTYDEHEKRIEIYHRILRRADSAETPDFWGSTQDSLGIAFRSRILGDRAENLERAIYHHQQALKVYSLTYSPAQWARTQNNLGIVFIERIRGDRAENLEQAIAHHQNALKVYTRDDSPIQWANTQSNLGNTFFHRVRGKRAENLEMAIHHYQQALEAYTRADFPRHWATVQNNLGPAFWERIRGDRAENLEQAIAHYQNALQVRSRTDFPEDWAGTQNNLGNVYLKRIRGDRAENLEQAIAHYQNALQVYTRSDFPVDWARTQNNLAIAFSDRVRGDRDENQEQGIAYFQGALLIYTRTDYPADWAMAQSNLGHALWKRIRGDRAENLEQAIAHYQNALQVYTRSDFPVDWARTQNNLGLVLRDRIRGNRAENLEQAISHYQAALQVSTRTDFPVNWADIQNSLGNAFRDRIHGNHAENIKKAVHHYREAITLHQELNLLDRKLTACRNLGYLYCIEQRWAEAHATLGEAIAVVESLRTEAFGEVERTKLAEDNAALYGWQADACLQLPSPRLQEAWERVEAGKGRLFLDQLSTSAFQSPPGIPQHLFDTETTLIQELRGLTNLVREVPDQARRQPLVAAQQQKHQRLEEVWTQIEKHKPHGLNYAALRRGDSIPFAHIREWVEEQGRDTALLEFYILEGKILLFALRSGWQEPLAFQIPLDKNDLFFRYLFNFAREVVDYPHLRQSGRQPSRRWQKLGEILFGQVAPLVQGVQLLYLIPHGPLHYIPLHALPVGGVPLFEQVPVAYAPSVAGLTRVQRRVGERKLAGTSPRRALVAGFTPNPGREREIFEGEAIVVADILKVKAHLGEAATSTLLQEQGSAVEVIHLSCHGRFTADSPLDAEVLLADGPITARQVMDLDLEADLVTLSACEAGLARPGPADDPTGLPRAFIYAGASSLLVPLWSVNAVSTQLLMKRFYSKLYDDDGSKQMNNAEALQEAALEIRDFRDENGHRPFTEPYFWAPFVLIGDWR